MILKTVRIKNFKSIKELEFEFPESGMLVLVGENNAGKSNIIRAIEAICGESWYGKDKMEDHDYYMRTKNNAVEIDLSFTNGHFVEFRQPSLKWGLEYYANKNKATRIFNTSIKEAYPCTYLGADRTFDKHLAFYDWTLIGRIRKAFHNKVAEVDGLDQALKSKFGELIELFDNVPGFADFKRDFADNFSNLFPLTSTSIGIDFRPFTPANLFKTMQILALDKDQSDFPLDLNELGEGARNLILISLLKSFAKNFKASGGVVNGLLALEEPELYLHPQAQRHLAKVLREIAETGYQVIISTHSSAFLDTEFFDSIGRVIKIEDPDCPKSRCTSLMTCSTHKLIEHCVKTGVSSEKVTPESVREFYKTTSNPRLNEGFFSRLLILVEGETEELSMPVYLKKVGIDCDGLGISILPVNGKGQLPKYWRLYSQFKIPIIVVFDNDVKSQEKRAANNQIANCFKVELEEIAGDIDIVRHIRTMDGTSLIVFEKDFEFSIKKELGEQEYDELDMAARELIKPLNKNSQKGVISRFIANKLIDREPAFIPRHTFILKEVINGILFPYVEEDEIESEELIKIIQDFT